MPNISQYNYEKITDPYDNNLERSRSVVGQTNKETVKNNIGKEQEEVSSPTTIDTTLKSGKEFNNIWLSSWIKSRNYKPQTQGFLIDAKKGYIECIELYVGGGGIIGGSLDIPDTTTSNSFHVDVVGNTWWGANVSDFNSNNDNASAYVLKDGTAKFQSVTLNTDVVISGLQTGSDVDGQYLSNLSVTATKIANATITGTKIDSGTITSSNITNGTITGTDIDSATIAGSNIASGTITSSNITNGTITGTDIDSATITSSNITNGTITGTDIDSATVTGSNIASGTITGSNIANATITGSNIDYLTVDTGNIANLAINVDKIANGTITGTKIDSATITSSNIASGTITGTDIDSATISGSNISSATITATNIDDLTITGGKIASSTITAGKINVTNLAAINADLGSITAGDISGITIDVASDIEVNDGATNVLKLNKNAFIARYGKAFSAEDSNTGEFFQFYCSGRDGIIQLGNNTYSSFKVMDDDSSENLFKVNNFEVVASRTLFPVSDSTYDCGKSSNRWSDVHTDALKGPYGQIWLDQTGRVEVTNHFDPNGAGSYNTGGSTRYWNDVSYKTLTDRGCLGWFDNGVELQDGRKVSDIEAIKAIKKDKKKKTVYGAPRLDYKTFPKVCYKKAADHNGKELLRDKNDEPYSEEIVDQDTGRTEIVKAEDGVEMTSLFSIMMGALKELDARLLKLENNK